MKPFFNPLDIEHSTRKNRCMFMQKKYQVDSLWLILAIIAGLLITGAMERRDLIQKQTIKTIKGQYSALQNKNYLVLEVDKSCADQLMNSKDGVLRIKIINQGL
jgi:hypothetical protein